MLSLIGYHSDLHAASIASGIIVTRSARIPGLGEGRHLPRPGCVRGNSDALLLLSEASVTVPSKPTKPDSCRPL